MSLAVDDEREALLDLVREDPELTPQEKETTLRFAKDEDRVAIYTDEAGIGRRLLAHPSARIEGVTVVDEPLTVKWQPDADDMEKCRDFGRKLARQTLQA